MPHMAANPLFEIMEKPASVISRWTLKVLFKICLRDYEENPLQLFLRIHLMIFSKYA
jgi:hypothetical protein